MKYEENLPLVKPLHDRQVEVDVDGWTYYVWLEWQGVGSCGTWLAYEPGTAKSSHHGPLATDDNPGTAAVKGARVLADRKKRKEKSRADLDEFEQKLEEFRNFIVAGLNRLAADIKKIRE